MSKYDNKLFLIPLPGSSRDERIEAICRHFDVPLYSKILVMAYGADGERLQMAEMGWLSAKNSLITMPRTCEVDCELAELTDQRFGFIVMNDVLQSVSHEVRTRLLQQASQMLVPNGYMACCFRPTSRAKINRKQRKTIRNEGSHTSSANHYIFASPISIEAFEKDCSRAGLKVVKRTLWLTAGHRLKVPWPFSRISGLRNGYTYSAWHLLQSRPD